MSRLKISAVPAKSVLKYELILALFIVSMITYVDRTSISTAKDPIAAELHLSDSAMGMIFSSFALGYAVMQVPAGWLADKVGPRYLLTGAVGLWSVLTAMTGAVWSFASLLTIRLFFGGAEAAVFPGAARAIRNWLEPGERGRANGALFAGSRIGAAVSYPLLAWMLTRWAWRRAFLVLGVIGLLWSIAWLLWFRDKPPVARSIKGPTGQPPHGIALSGSWVSLPLGLAVTQYFASNFTNFIGLSWMLPYLETQYHLSNSRAAFYSMAPLLLGATSQGIAGWTVDRMYSSRLWEWSRRIPAIVGFALAGIGLLRVTHARTVGAAVLAFTIAIFGADLTISPSWVFCADIAGERTGRISGMMNMFGSFGAFASATAFPFLARRSGSSSPYFELAAAGDVLGMACWVWMRSLKREKRLQGGTEA